MKHLLLAAGLAALALPETAAAEPAHVEVVAKNVEGAHADIGLEIRPSADGDVHYRLIAKHGDPKNVQLSLDRDASGIHVRATYTLVRGWLSWFSTDEYRLEVQVPVGDELAARTDMGGIDARGAWPMVSANTGAGGVELADAPIVVVRTGNGGVSVRAAKQVDIRTGNGGVEAQLVGRAPQASVRTGNGGVSIDLPAGATPSTDLRTGLGGISNPLSSAKGPGHLDIRTGNGGITVTVAH